jgi:hypothetical protein
MFKLFSVIKDSNPRDEKVETNDQHTHQWKTSIDPIGACTKKS